MDGRQGGHLVRQRSVNGMNEHDKEDGSRGRRGGVGSGNVVQSVVE